ncbi:MAG: hypothetical protein RLZZ458_2315, partial [Planctomycetota bacterium]
MLHCVVEQHSGGCRGGKSRWFGMKVWPLRVLVGCVGCV